MEGRKDRRHCSKACRQAAWRFRSVCGGTSPIEQRRGRGEARRLAYADPPYPGLAHYYRGRPDYGGEVDHRELVSRLQQFDGWALSTSARALPRVLRLFEVDPLVAIWDRGPRKVDSYSAAISWEPLIYKPARRVFRRAAEALPDLLRHEARPARSRGEARCIGAKPPAFSVWMFQLIGAEPGDELEDLYPGSGAVGMAWAEWCRRRDESDVSGSAERLNDAKSRSR